MSLRDPAVAGWATREMATLAGLVVVVSTFTFSRFDNTAHRAVAPGTRVVYRRATGLKPIEVSIQEPQLQPPPPSGERSMPPAGMLLSQQSGRSRLQLDVFADSGSQTVSVPERKNSAPDVQA